MYRSKNEGKNKVTFFSKSIYDNFVLQNNLKKDLENGLKNNEIKVYYQPILSVKENKITRCEALVRWNHNLYGLISPSKFFDVAKELNLISNIDFIVMESACITLKNWLLKNYNTKIQLNLYFETLAQAEFVKKLCDILNKHNIEPSSIIFEIIEDERVNDNAFVIKNIIKMRQLGIQFAIDNYGQGFSDFSALKKFKPNYIKIDQTLIKVIGEDKIKIKNIGLLVNFLKTFKGEIIAVGVETSSQNKILSELKIDYLQGYFYGKAVDVEEYEKLYLN